MRLKLDLDTETTALLVESADRERRPVVWQAEVILRRALGLPVPVYNPRAVVPSLTVAEEGSRHD